MEACTRDLERAGDRLERACGATVHRARTDRRGCARGLAVGGSGARTSPHPCALPIAGGRVRDGKPAAGDGCTRRRSARAAAAAREAPPRTRCHAGRHTCLRRHAPGRRPCRLGHPGCAPLVARAPADTRHSQPRAILAASVRAATARLRARGLCDSRGDVVGAIVTLRSAALTWRVPRGAWAARLGTAALWLLPVSVVSVVWPPGQELVGDTPLLAAAIVA